MNHHLALAEITLAFQSILVKVLEDNSKVQMNLSHRLCLQVITISSTEDKVLALQLWPSPQKVLCHLFPHAAHGAPRVTVNIVHTRRCGNVNVAIAIQFIPTIAILMPDFEVNLWPT